MWELLFSDELVPCYVISPQNTSGCFYCVHIAISNFDSPESGWWFSVTTAQVKSPPLHWSILWVPCRAMDRVTAFNCWQVRRKSTLLKLTWKFSFRNMYLHLQYLFICNFTTMFLYSINYNQFLNRYRKYCSTDFISLWAGCNVNWSLHYTPGPPERLCSPKCFLLLLAIHSSCPVQELFKQSLILGLAH